MKWNLAVRFTGATAICFWLALLALTSGCSGTRSSLNPLGKESAKIWPITGEEADGVAYTAVSTVIEGQPTIRSGGPFIGYQASWHFLGDYHNFIATALPASGKTTNNVEVTGYAFEVQHSGTYLDGASAASRIYKTIVVEAGRIAPPVEVTVVKRLTPGAGRRAGRLGDSGTNYMASGTGFFISDDGYLVTCAHVVKDAKRIEIKTRSGTYLAKLVQSDVPNDIAILKVEGKFGFLPLVSSRMVKLGESVRTLGFPNPDLQGIEPKLTSGEVNSLSGIRDDPRCFQVSMPIQPGNSGGPLVDSQGNVVGIVTSTLNPLVTVVRSGSLPQNVNYAIKSSYILTLAESVPALSTRVVGGVAHTSGAAENVIKRIQEATVLVLVY